MTERVKTLWDDLKKWHPLTEIPVGQDSATHDPGPTSKGSPPKPESSATDPSRPLLDGVSPALTNLLWDILCYPYSSVRARIKRLGPSVRLFEKAKAEGCEKSFLLESSAGQTKYLIPTPKTFDAFGRPNPYKRAASIEHSYYVGWGCFMLEKDPYYKSVRPEAKVGISSCTSDIVTTAHDGTRHAWEITLSAGNAISNAAKYHETDFARIIFSCREYKLKEAVKAYIREARLDANLLARIEFTQFSALLRRQRKLSLY